MTELKRYDCGTNGYQWCQGCYRMNEEPDGDFVRFDDVAHLLGGHPFPAELTPPVRHVLSLMLWQTLPIANALRATGRHINRKTEDEQAAALHWLLGIALEHGQNWEQAAARALHQLLSEKKGV